MKRTTTLAVLAVVVLTAGALPTAVLASHEPESTDYTVETNNPSPGASASYSHYVNLTDNFGDARSGFETVDSVTFTMDAGSVDNCSSPTAGDVANNSHLSVTDDREDSAGGGTGQEEFDSYERSFSGRTADFSISDDEPDYRVGETLRLDLNNDCVKNPSSKGWYQVDVTVEGTSFGDGDGDSIQLSSTSHYYPICDGCDNDSAAREELGPPPSEESPTPTATATDTPTPTATATPTATPPPDPADPTATPSPEPGDPTATPSPEPADPTATATATAEPADQEVFGVNPMVVVAVVAAVSIGLAAFGASRL
ncbi:hypothetical protein BRC85_09975 [Halobacteriales archaeon QS_1_69_70]|nr:MAG: hypothetical protein BRC85_09975 [Halobacteriales archaeon QS_1_69_70]